MMKFLLIILFSSFVQNIFCQQYFGLYNVDPSSYYKCIHSQGNNLGNDVELVLERCDTGKTTQVLAFTGYNFVLQSGRCMTVASSTVGTHVTQSDCVGSAGQTWTFAQNLGSPGFQFINPNSGLCLTSQNSGAYLDIQTCDTTFATLTQLWTFTLISQAFGPIYNIGFGGTNALQTINQARTANAEFELKPYTGNQQQKAQFATGSNPTTPGFLAIGFSCMEVNAGSPLNGVHIIQGAECSSTWDHEFNLIGTLVPGPFQIQNSNSDKCVTAATDGSYIYLSTCTSQSENSYQYWTFQFSPQSIQNHFQNYLIGDSSGCLRVTGDTDNSAALQINNCNTQSGLMTVDNLIALNISPGKIKFSNGTCLSVNGAGLNDGDVVGQYDCQDPLPDYQKWQFIGGNVFGFIQIKNINSGKCLNYNQASGGVIDQQTCTVDINDSKSQIWSFR